METTKQQQRGISLLEVLAAIFVVSIGLLGVLAVIPFGAFQVSKAQHAEYASNMLANAAEEIFIRNMGKESWDTVMPPDYTKFVWCSPYKITDTPQIRYLEPLPLWRDHDVMRGQDDLVYTTYNDKRPDFSAQKEKIQSSGKYTWFFTYLPKENEDAVAVDILACYNRVAEDDMQVPDCTFVPSWNGGAITGFDTSHVELLSQTKYVFVTWETTTSELGGAWCRIVFLDKSIPKAVVTGSLPDTVNNSMNVYIPCGVLYHKRVQDVLIK